MNSGIYLIQNTMTRLSYVGQSANIPRRLHEHRSYMRRGVVSRGRGNAKLINSFAKRGEAAFQFVVLEYCEKKELTAREDYWLREFRDQHCFPVANFDGPADNPWRGQKHKPEALARIAKKSRDLVRTEVHRRRISDAQKGRKMSDAQKVALSIAVTGMRRPWLDGDLNPSCREDARQRLRGDGNPAKREDVRRKIGIKNSRQVRDESTGREWPSISALAIEFGISISSASSHLAGETKCAVLAPLRLTKIPR